MKIQYVNAIYLMTCLTNFYDFWFTAVIGIHPTKSLIVTAGEFQKCNLKERYAIKFCFKLGKNSTEMNGMLQTAFRPSYMNRTSVFEWHKRFKEGRESVRDDEGCGRYKEVNTPELIGQRVTMSRF